MHTVIVLSPAIPTSSEVYLLDRTRTQRTATSLASALVNRVIACHSVARSGGDRNSQQVGNHVHVDRSPMRIQQKFRALPTSELVHLSICRCHRRLERRLLAERPYLAIQRESVISNIYEMVGRRLWPPMQQGMVASSLVSPNVRVFHLVA